VANRPPRPERTAFGFLGSATVQMQTIRDALSGSRRARVNRTLCETWPRREGSPRPSTPIKPCSSVERPPSVSSGWGTHATSANR